MSFLDLSKPDGLKAFDEYIATKMYIQGYLPTTLDAQVFKLLGKAPDAKYTHAVRYYSHIAHLEADGKLKSVRQGGAVPAQLAGSVAAPVVNTSAPSAAPAAAKSGSKVAEEKPEKKEKQQKQEKAAPAPAAASTPAAAPSGDNAQLAAQVAAQGEKVRELKAAKADKAVVQAEVAKLLELKKQLEAAGGAPASAPAPAVVAAPAPVKEEPKKEEPAPKKEEAAPKTPKKEESGEKKGKGKKEETPKKEEAAPKKEEVAPKKEEVAAPKKEETPKKEEGGKKDKKDKSKKKSDKEEVKKDDAKDSGEKKVDAKLLAAVQKEGGKKGQDILGVNEMGGLEFFCCSVDTPEGDLELTNVCLDNMNKEIDPEAEEKRGGAAAIGKMLFSAGVKQLALVARVPADKTSRINAGEWMKAVLAVIQGKEVGKFSEAYAQGVVEANPDAGRFPIKLKDDAISAAVGYLKNHGCFPDQDDDDDDQCYGDDDFQDFPDS